MSDLVLMGPYFTDVCSPVKANSVTPTVPPGKVWKVRL